MKELSPQQKRKLEKLAKVIDCGNVAILEHLFEIEEKIEDSAKEIEEKLPKLENIIEKVRGQKGDTGESIKGEKGDDGYTPRKGVDYVDGKDGRTPIFIGKSNPIKPQKGDLWYQD